MPSLWRREDLRKEVGDMRTAYGVGLLLGLLAWSVTGCLRSKSPGVGEQAEAPKPPSAQPARGTTAPP